MILSIIQHQNNIEAKNYSGVLTSREEINCVKSNIAFYLSIMKQNVVTHSLPYEELYEGLCKEFVSDMFQIIETENYIDITVGDTNIQIRFSTTCETSIMEMAA